LYQADMKDAEFRDFIMQGTSEHEGTLKGTFFSNYKIKLNMTKVAPFMSLLQNIDVKR